MSFRFAHACLGALVCLHASAGNWAGGLGDLARRCAEVHTGRAILRILQFGDSHTAFPGTQRAFQVAFQGSFGRGGAGFGLPWVRPQAGLRCQASSGWRRAPKDLPAGSAGLQNGWLEATRPGETAVAEGAFSHLRLHFQSLAEGGSARILADGRPLGEIQLRSEAPALALFERDLPSGNHRLEVVTKGAGIVRILGLSLEEARGAVDGFAAFNGFQAAWLLEIPEDLFATQIRAEHPDLAILAFGTNEANEPLFEPEPYRRNLSELLARFRKAAPDAAIALIGPPDAGLPKALPGALEAVVAIHRETAEAAGAAFWDQRAFMGGAGAIEAWNRAGLAREDRVHFTAEGYRRLVQGFLEDLSRRLGVAFPPAPPAQPSQADAHPIYVFKTADGRTLIVDDPATVAGERGEWVGRAPR